MSKMRAQAEANLSALIESTEDYIWSVDLQYGLINFNRAFQQHYERSFGAHAAVGMRPEQMLPPAIAAKWPPLFERVLSEGPFRIEYSFVSGQILELSLNPIVVDGKTAGISVFGKDITERKAAETALREAERKYREIFDGAVEGIFQTSADHKILTVNRALAEMLGYDSTDELTAAIKNLTQDVWVDPNDDTDILRQLEEQGTVQGFECRLKRKDGAAIWVSLSARRVCDAGGQLLYHQGFLNDITERRRAAEAQAEHEAGFKTYFDENGSVMLLVDPSSGEIVDANHAASAFYGYPREQLVGMYTSQIDTMTPEELALDRQRAFSKECNFFTYRARLASGEVRDIEVYSSPFVVGGRPLLHGIIHDISRRKRAQKALRDSEERYRATFEQAAVGIVHTSFDGRILQCNARFAEIIGYPIEEIPGLTVQQITAPEDIAAGDSRLQQMAGGVTSIATWEKRNIRKDGSFIWVRISDSLQCDAEGRPLHCIAVVEDISARKEAEELLVRATEALRLSEEHYRMAFQTSLDSISINRLSDGSYIDVNPAFFNIIGYKREEVIGRASQELNIWVHPSDREVMAETLRTQGKIENLEFQYRRKNGTIFWGLTSASHFDLDGVPCLLGIIRDITTAKTAAEALRASEERYRTAFQMSLDAINISRIDDGMFVDVNEAFLRNTGYARDEVVGHTSQDVDIWANPEDRRKLFEALRQNSACVNLEAQFRCKNGTLLWGLLSASVIDLDGVPCILTVVRDVSEAKMAAERLAVAQEALRASEVRYRTAFHASPNAVNIFRLDDGMYLDVNPSFLDATGFEREEVIGRTALELNAWANPRELQEILESLKRNNVFRGEVKLKKKSGETFWGLMSASVFEHEGASCVLSVTQDLSDVKAAQDEINKLSFYDPLTHLPNRRLLMDRLLRSPLAASRTRRKRALLFVDLDNFKSLNDALGHQTGDLLLQEAALRLDSCVRKSDTVARCGGDEFAVMLENLSEVDENAAAQAQIIGEKILALCDQPYLLAGHECHCPSSIGITVFGEELESANDALQRAEMAMFQAKEAGRNTIRFFAPALQAAVNARAAMEVDLRVAIKTSQFALYFQPQVERGRLIGAEALLRWMHPEHGLLAPGEFIPLAEETGLILPLGDWVLEAACAQLAAWAARKETAALALAVNISARQFRQPDFVERVLAALNRTGANPLTLKLELTESMLLDNVDDVISKMTALKSHGLRLSLDDFGTGYSSLAYLKRLPLDELKIDLTFVRDLLDDAASGAIAQAILSLGKAMNLRVIAEGVETEEQRDFLIRIGCHSFQGFLFSRPLPLEEFQLWLPDSSGKAALITKKVKRISSSE